MLAGGGVILGALKCKEINSSGEIKADNISLNNGIVTLGSSNQIYQFPSGQYTINILTKAYDIGALSILDTITFSRIAPLYRKIGTYTLGIVGNTTEVSDYSVLNESLYGRPTITISNVKRGSFVKSIGTVSCTMSFDGAISDGEILLIEYNSYLTNITIT